jgi:hypothetical protein
MNDGFIEATGAEMRVVREKSRIPALRRGHAALAKQVPGVAGTFMSEMTDGASLG